MSFVDDLEKILVSVEAKLAKIREDLAAIEERIVKLEASYTPPIHEDSDTETNGITSEEE